MPLTATIAYAAVVFEFGLHTRKLTTLSLLCAWLAFCGACSLSGRTWPGERDASVTGRDGATASHDTGLPQCADASDGAAMPPSRLPHNIIVVMGDGMGAEQLSTARYVQGRAMRVDGMRGPAWVSTDSLTTRMPDQKPTDSAAAATAIATGVLVDNGVLSVGPDGTALRTVLEDCQAAGKSTGLVTTSYFFDASPSAFAVHRASRYDGVDIVRELLTVTRPDVIMGSGAALLDDPANGLLGFVADGGYFRVGTKNALTAWDPNAHPRLLGLFDTTFVPATDASESFTMTPELERTDSSPDPRLQTMAMRAIDRLSLDPDGFFLFVEDELFDELGHRGPAEAPWTNRAYGPQARAFDDTVGALLDWVQLHSSYDDTLLVVLADHETGGYRYDHSVGPDTGEFTAYSQGNGLPVGQHTRTKVPLYALGPGSQNLDRVTDHVGVHALLVGEFR